MKTFLAIYIGTEAAFERAQWTALDDATRKQRETKGFDAWVAWGKENAAAIVVEGGPLGKTKRVAPEGTSDIKNVMTGYIVVKAETHADAARMFENHPHFSIFPGDSVEIMECTQMPTR